MKLFYILCVGLLLTGCATTQEPQKVYVPVVTKCYDKPIPKKPDLFVDKMSGEEEPDMLFNGMKVDIEKLEDYSKELLTYICK